TTEKLSPVAAGPSTLDAPIGQQEVWAAGVTYLRSREARMEESKETGGDTFYDRVYRADRPELFFKATPHRVDGPGQPVRVGDEAHARGTGGIPLPRQQFPARMFPADGHRHRAARQLHAAARRHRAHHHRSDRLSHQSRVPMPDPTSTDVSAADGDLTGCHLI